jgi:C4-dicarboxylate-specific signal transduction histidine kinase
MKSERLRKPRQSAELGEDVRALVDALPFPAALSAPDGRTLHANDAMRGAPRSGARETCVVVLPGIGECTLSIERPSDAQTQRLAALGFMVAGVCHDVSNPLAAIHSMLQILQSKRGVSAETLSRGLASIAANIDRVLAITRKLGNFSRVGTEAPSPVAIDAAMEAAAALLRHSEQAPEVAFAYRGAPGAMVRARPGQLDEVLFNILLNAAQAMGGKGRIEAETRIAREDSALICVRDTGPGIRAEHLARVFEPFFTTKAPGQGTGLGLAISYEIVHELGGEVRATNDPRGGARIELELPLWRKPA